MPQHLRLDAVQAAGTPHLVAWADGAAVNLALKQLVARATPGDPAVLSFAGAETVAPPFLAAAVGRLHMTPDFNPLCLSVIDLAEDHRQILQRVNAEAIRHRDDPEAWGHALRDAAQDAA